MIIVGLTGGIASGKTTILNFIKKQNIPTHDSDKCVSKLYKNPSMKFLQHLKSIGLGHAIKGKKINKKEIQLKIFYNKTTLKKLEQFIHVEVNISRNIFLEKNKKLNKKIVFLDIPLLLEKKLESICDYIFLAFSPKHIRKKRALKRKKIDKQTLDNIINHQITDKIKKTKSDFIIHTSTNKKSSYNEVLKAIKQIINKKNERSCN